MTDRAKAMWPFVAFCGVNVVSSVVFSFPISIYLEITRPTSW